MLLVAPGPPLNSRESACSTSSAMSSASTRSTSGAGTTWVRGEPPLAMLSGQPFSGISDQGMSRPSSGGSSIGRGSSRRQARGGRDGPLPRHRRGFLPRSCTRATLAGGVAPRGGGILSDETTHISLEPRRQGRRRDPATPARPRTPDHVGPGRLRRARRGRSGDVTVRYGDTDIAPFALRPTGGAGRPPWPTTRCSTPRASCVPASSRWPPKPLEDKRDRSRDRRRGDRRAGLAR